MQSAIHDMPFAKGRASMASKSWSWIRRHWLDLMVPPAIFLLCAGITRQMLWVRGEQFTIDASGLLKSIRHWIESRGGADPAGGTGLRGIRTASCGCAFGQKSGTPSCR